MEETAFRACSPPIRAPPSSGRTARKAVRRCDTCGSARSAGGPPDRSSTDLGRRPSSRRRCSSCSWRDGGISAQGPDEAHRCSPRAVSPPEGISAPPAGVVWPVPARPAVAAHPRPVPNPRLRDHAAADPGRTGHSEVSRMADQVSVARGAGQGREGGGARGVVSARVQHPAGATARHRPGGRAPAPRPDPRLARRPAGPTGDRPVHGGGSAQLRLRAGCANPGHKCAARAAQGFPRRSGRAARSATVEAGGGAPPARQRVRFQPGHDGFRGHRLHSAAAELPGVRARRALRILSLGGSGHRFAHRRSRHSRLKVP